MATALLDREAKAGFERMQRDPAGWIRTFLGSDLWDKQTEIAASVRDHRRTAVPGDPGLHIRVSSAVRNVWCSLFPIPASTNRILKNFIRHQWLSNRPREADTPE